METSAFFGVGIKISMRQLHENTNHTNAREVYRFLLSQQIWGPYKIMVVNDMELTHKLHTYKFKFTHDILGMKNQMLDIDIIKLFFKSLPDELYESEVCYHISDDVCEVRKYHNEETFFCEPGFTSVCSKPDVQSLQNKIQQVEKYIKDSKIDFEIVFMNTIRTRII